MGLTSYKLAKALDVPLPRVNDIVLEKRSISAEMGLLLSTYFGMTDQYWINLQADYERRLARAYRKKAEVHQASSHEQGWIAEGCGLNT